MNKLINIFIFSMVTLPLFASVELRDEAIVENKVLTVISARFEELKLKQIDSNVFLDGDIKESQEVINTISTIKEENIKDVISSLEETVSTRSAAVKNKGYLNAQNEYGLAVAQLNGISKEMSAKLKVTSQKNELLEKQKELLKDLLKFNKEKSEPLNEEDLNKIIDMAARQEDLSKDATDEKTKKEMQAAQEDIENARIDDAIDKQKEIVNDLEKKLGFDADDNNQQEDSDREEADRKTNKAIEEMKRKLQDSAKNKNELTDSERQEMAQKMSDISEDMKKENEESQQSSESEQNEQSEQSSESQKNEQSKKSSEAQKNEQRKKSSEALKKASRELEKAMENMLESKDENAAKNLEKAQEQMKKSQEQRKQQAKNQAEEKKKSANKAAADEKKSSQEESKSEKKQGESGEDASEKSESENENKKRSKDAPKGESNTKHGIKYGKTRAVDASDDWTAKLPEKERSAIQAARAAKSSPEMEEDIRRYFILLAREKN